MSKKSDWGLWSLKPTWQKAALGIGLLVLMRKKPAADAPKLAAGGDVEPDSDLAGPLTISIEHDISGADYVYERAGTPAIWGRGLTHQDIKGTDDNPHFVGEYTHVGGGIFGKSVLGNATGPAAPPPPSGGGNTTMYVLGGLGVLLLGAAVLMPEKKARTNSATVPTWLLRRRARIAANKRNGTYLKRRRRLAA